MRRGGFRRREARPSGGRGRTQFLELGPDRGLAQAGRGQVLAEPLALGAAVMLVEWLILWWMHRRQIFLRI